MDRTLEHDAFPAEPRRLSTFIRERQAEILAQWVASVRELPRADGLEQPALFDHIPGFLARIAELADEYVAGGEPLLPSEIADLHALERLSEGFDLDEVVRELAILRDCIMRLWSEQARVTRSDALGIRALDQAIDRAIGASIQRYTAARDRTLQSLDRISAAALETRSLDAFLDRLLHVLLETTAAVDTATIVLRDGDLLRTRASAGLEAEVASGFAIRIGEGFIGKVAATQRPQFIEDVAADATVLSPSLRASGVNALFGVPLVEAGEVIGVAHMGSRTANSFSKQDRHLFLAMVTRATAGIVQHQLRDAADRRADQQQAVATIGMRALAATDLGALFAEAVEVVTSALRVELAAVLELQADHRLAVTTEAGWGVQSAGLREPARLESYAGFTVLAGAPALVNDLESDTRFRFPPVFRERGVTSCVGVAIPIPGEHAGNYGVLAAYAIRARAFSPEDVRFLQALAHTLGTAVALRRSELDREQRERALEQALAKHEHARAEAERALAVLDSVLAASSLGIGFIDPTLRYIRINDALAAINGLPADQHIGRTIGEVLAGPVATFVEPLVRKVLETREPVANLEFEGAPPSTPDQVRSFLANYVPVVTPNGELLGVGAVVIEITERKRAEEALRVSEARLQGILDHAPAAIYCKDAAGRLILGNKRVAALMGQPVEQLLGHEGVDRLPPEVADDMRSSDREVLRSGKPLEVETTIASNGSTRTFLSTKFPLPGPAGEAFLCGIATDITERKRMELDLRERELQFRTLADNIPQLVWMTDRTGGGAWCNRRWYEYTGLTFEQTQVWGEAALHPDHRERVSAKFRHHVASGEAWEDTFPLRGADGRYRWFLSRAIPIRDDQGDVVRWFGTNTDVTEQRFMGEAMSVLSSSLDHRQTLDCVAHLAVPALGDWCAVALVEDGALATVAVAHVDPEKTELAWQWMRTHAPDPDAPRGVPAVIRTGRSELVSDVTDELLVESRDPEHLELMRTLGLTSYVVVPLVTRGRTIGALTLVSAESGRRYTATDLEMLEELGKRAGLAIDNARLYDTARREAALREEVLAVVSHDLRNPLGAIQLAAAVLLDKPEEPPTRHVEMVHRAASRMEHLIDDLLDMAGIQAGRLAIERKAEDGDSLVREAIESHEAMASEKGLTLIRTCALAGARLSCDRDRVLQVFGNLLGNAIKFARSGDTITVRCGVTDHEVRFAVTDTGPGIGATELPHIFEPYWSAKRHVKQGTGLGLYIGKGIIEAHGGRLWVESTPGIETTFYFTLPLAR